MFNVDTSLISLLGCEMIRVLYETNVSHKGANCVITRSSKAIIYVTTRMHVVGRKKQVKIYKYNTTVVNIVCSEKCTIARSSNV